MSDMAQTLAKISQDPEYSRLELIPGVRVELRYASPDNFMNRDVYGSFREGFLHHKAARMLAQAARAVGKARPGHALLVLDALRPRSAQRILWDHVKGTEQERYVANPDRGSLHNYGCAVDLTVIDAGGRELDMGTGFDAFVPLSQPKLEQDFVALGKLTRAQLENRLLLRRAMEGAGFIQLPHEWWHYDAFPGDQVRAEFRIVE